MNAAEMPASLNEAIMSEPLWLQAWVLVLVIVNLVAILFVVKRREGGGLAIRPEPAVIVAAFLAAAACMGWLYEQVGYVRLLGLAHLVCWGPAWAWILTRRRTLETGTRFGTYVRAYLVVAGISLAIDLVDVLRYLVGDGELLNRWS